MKKVVIILLFLFLFASCNKYIATNLYERNYTEESVALSDVYKNLNYYEMDSIYIDSWIPNMMTTDTITIDQRMIRKPINENSTYTFVLTKYLYPSGFYYTFLIRFTGKEKDLKK